METRRHKKLIVAAVLVGVLLFASLGGVVLATGPEEGGLGDFIDKVITNYEKETGDEIEYPEALEQAFTNARVDMCKDRAEMRAATMERRLQDLTDEQKEALQEWWDSRPEDLPMRFGGHKDGGFLRGMCKPPAPAE